MMLMLSTDTCRHILREQPSTLLTRLQKHSSSGEEVVISAITYAELLAAAMLTAEQSRHMQLVHEFSERLDAVMPWDMAAVDMYSAIQMRALQGGYAVNMNDAMLAAHAMSLKACLLCLSDASFVRMEGLTLEVIEAE